MSRMADDEKWENQVRPDFPISGIDPSPERQKDVWLFAVGNPAKFIKKKGISV